MLNKTEIEFSEYDLNLFYEDLGHDADGVNQWADTYTIQPSMYIVYKDGRSVRHYLDAFKLDLGETRMLEPDFPVDFWGSDFFISMEAFMNIAKTVPNRIVDILEGLPGLDELDTSKTDSVGINSFV